MHYKMIKIGLAYTGYNISSKKTNYSVKTPVPGVGYLLLIC